MNAAVFELPECVQKALAERPTNEAGEPLCKCGSVVGSNVFDCTACSRARERERREEWRIEQAETERRNTLAYALKSVPPWDWVDDPVLFKERVRSPKFRAVADRYDLSVGNLALLGETGLGKTVTLVRTARRLVHSAVEAGHRMRGKFHPILALHWCSALSLAGARARTPLGRDEAEEVVDAIAAPVLVIDELGFESTRDPTVMLEILNERYEKQRITLITSGATPEHLKERYGQGAFRRLIEPKGKLIEDWSSGGGG